MILKAILEHFNLDPEVHCNRPEIPVQKKRKRNVKTRETLIGNDSEEEEDIADRLNNSMNDEGEKDHPEEDYSERDGEEEEDEDSVQDKIKNKGLLRKKLRTASPPSPLAVSRSASTSPSVSRSASTSLPYASRPASTSPPPV